MQDREMQQGLEAFGLKAADWSQDEIAAYEAANPPCEYRLLFAVEKMATRLDTIVTLLERIEMHQSEAGHSGVMVSTCA